MDVCSERRSCSPSPAPCAQEETFQSLFTRQSSRAATYSSFQPTNHAGALEYRLRNAYTWVLSPRKGGLRLIKPSRQPRAARLARHGRRRGRSPPGGTGPQQLPSRPQQRRLVGTAQAGGSRKGGLTALVTAPQRHKCCHHTQAEKRRPHGSHGQSGEPLLCASAVLGPGLRETLAQLGPDGHRDTFFRVFSMYSCVDSTRGATRRGSEDDRPPALLASFTLRGAEGWGCSSTLITTISSNLHHPGRVLVTETLSKNSMKCHSRSKAPTTQHQPLRGCSPPPRRAEAPHSGQAGFQHRSRSVCLSVHPCPPRPQRVDVLLLPRSPALLTLEQFGALTKKHVMLCRVPRSTAEGARSGSP